ncbi:Regulator of polyketide synthase expression [Operophtera brumata]|uniref:Regulator of polyketide synthase expression n=1 Tax=Operophtera brumata TaxID=104452 RepID=A0A0L7KSQ9_OPEBR|nr:Regulator of polyketide synthase expression [Operophtera brumata]
MSGKPASVGASRAAAAGAPRVLVYVEPRQLEPGAARPEPPPDHPRALPRHASYRPTTNTVYYKPLHDNYSKFAVYGSTESITQRTEFFPASQQNKGPSLKLEESRSERVKQDCVERVGAEFSGVETFQGRIPVESVDLGTYQTRCSGPLAADTMPSMQQIALRQGHNQFSESVTVHSEGSNSERELSVGKSYVNYQILEQSVSHQSIVNQSISILNQQVGVSRGISSEGDAGNTPQLLRTADGVVLAVLPAPVITQQTDVQDSCRTAQSDSPQTITVPLGWRRIISVTSVLYLR